MNRQAEAKKTMSKHSKKPRSAKPTVGNTNTTVEESNEDLRARSWCWTLNNYTEEEYEKFTHLHTPKLEKWIIGLEVGPKCGTPHLQAYYQFKDAVSWKTMKKLMPRANFRKANGTSKQNYIYCSKGGRFVCGGFDKVKKERIDAPFWGELQDYADERAQELSMEYGAMKFRGPTPMEGEGYEEETP